MALDKRLKIGMYEKKTFLIFLRVCSVSTHILYRFTSKKKKNTVAILGFSVIFLSYTENIFMAFFVSFYVNLYILSNIFL